MLPILRLLVAAGVNEFLVSPVGHFVSVEKEVRQFQLRQRPGIKLPQVGPGILSPNPHHPRRGRVYLVQPDTEFNGLEPGEQGAFRAFRIPAG